MHLVAQKFQYIFTARLICYVLLKFC